MNDLRTSGLGTLLEGHLGLRRAEWILDALEIPAALCRPLGDTLTRAELAMVLDAVLFEDLVRRVPHGALYVQDQVRSGRKILFDHGALRTVKAPSGGLPPGEAAITRILEPLGYAMSHVYPMERLRMTGRSWTHQDLPYEVPQFFVSELHPDRFSGTLQRAMDRVVGSSRDPLSAQALDSLARLSRAGVLPFPEALLLLPELASAFDRQHGIPGLADYEVLLEESEEAAWIATEGNAFNHATDRVADVEALAEAQKALGRPMKEDVEVSTSGRVLQTALRAAPVERPFIDRNGSLVLRTVPGSFFEFITRRPTAAGALDLAFDASNAQAIFRMTAGSAR